MRHYVQNIDVAMKQQNPQVLISKLLEICTAVESIGMAMKVHNLLGFLFQIFHGWARFQLKFFSVTFT